jgi:hypothetical protein
VSEAAGVAKGRTLADERERLAMLLSDSDDAGERDDLCDRIAVIDVALIAFPQGRMHRRPPHIPIG